MRSLHSSVLALLFAAWSSVGMAQPAAHPPASDFRIFVGGAQVGTEQVSVTRTPDGVVISGTGRLGAPMDIATNRCEMRYDAQWRPLEAVFDALIRGQYVSLHSVFTAGTAVTQLAQSGRQSTSRTDKVGAEDVILLNTFFGLYEGLSGRLQGVQAGSELKAYVLTQAEITVQVKAVTDERVQSPGKTIPAKHYELMFVNPAGPVRADLWADGTGRLLRLAIPAQALEVARDDVASVAARFEVAHREGDEQVRIPANGFSLAGTVSKPAGWKAGGRARYPTVVLIGGSGPADRDELAFGIPIFAQLADALANGGFLVVRYDKRGVGQSGGRADGATLEQYGEDARAVVDFVRKRKDVDPKGIALAGHNDGGWAAMLAARENNRVAALVLMETPGVSGAQLVLEQQEHMLQRSSLPPAEQKAKTELQKKVQNAVLTGSGWEGVPPDLRRQADTPWFRSLLAFNPAVIMRDLKQPILIVQGELDRQVFAWQADRLGELARARKGAASRTVTVVRLPGVNHLLVRATTGEYDEYQKLSDRNVSKDVLSTVANWLQKTLAPPKK